jgi:small-conductance mechanosensitive channel
MSMAGPRRIIAALLALLCLVGTALAFDEALVRKAERAIEEYRPQLLNISKELQNPSLDERQLVTFRDRLELIRADAVKLSTSLSAPIAEVNQQLASLGPTPSGSDAEPSSVADERRDLLASLNRLSGIKSRLDVGAVEAEQLAGRIAAIQRNSFLERIFESDRPILSPSLWVDTGAGISLFASRLGGLFSAWWDEVRATVSFRALLLIPIFASILGVGYVLLRRGLVRWTRSRPQAQQSPNDLNRLWRIFRALITAVVALIILYAPIRIALKLGGFVTPRFDLILTAVFEFILASLIYYVLALRVFSPGNPAWRIINLGDVAASRLPTLVGLAGLVSVGNERMLALADAVFLPVSYTIGQSALSALAMLILLSLIVLTIRQSEGLTERLPQQKLYFGWAAATTPLVWLLIAAGFVALLLGYLALANYIAQQLFQTGIVLVVLFLLHHLSDAAVDASFDPQSGFGRFLRNVTGLGERAIERLGLLFRTVFDIVLVLAGLPLLFALWTVTWIDMRSMLTSATIGFNVGDINISPRLILVILVTFALGILLTKLVISWLDRRILSNTRINRGVQDSLRTGATYAGYILAAVFALSAAGLDFSNLALVAGALGVGIGLGLQSIVNNFVSGLILLAERPIRVGDWVALPAGEGIVKRINVRSTEIETFDSCSIIVPNSSLITEPVRNWTHGSNRGRFIVAVTVDQESDPVVVLDILTEIARANDKILTYPEPNVALVRFGPLGLDFELKAFVPDILDGAMVASDVRFEILRIFREKGITIPNPVGVFQAPRL